ncbi:unnamed protein product [Ceutorhynchus assimilis]|uniref:CCHC-type domain-containing protein n=1 Tax=Ceutorhynchus assimilis TaxID=467358 RepID=A0A9N9MGL8_9CUCU|nr:unnamed protein product [Ceutorhynchus assimilis]
MNALTAEQEPAEAIEERIGKSDPEEVRLGSLRANANCTQTATITLSKAEKLMEHREKAVIRVGMISCIEWRVGSICRGHMTTSKEIVMNEIEANYLCFRCGERGNSTRECEGDEACLVYRKDGHRAGSGKCRLFRRALSSIDQQQKK